MAYENLDELGIGRVPADAGATSEAMAEIEAAKITARYVSPNPLATCNGCGRSVSRGMLMTSWQGNVCPDCYDED